MASPIKQFQHVIGRAPTSGHPQTVTPQRLKPLDPAAMPHYWHPDRDGVEHPPSDFAARLTAIHPDLRLTKPPANAPVAVLCWQLWYRKLSIRHPLCPGWSLLMLWELGSVPLPLDERLFAAIYHFDARHMGDAVQYFDRIISERDRARQARNDRYYSELRDHARDFIATRRISTAGRGNRFAMHHDGTILPSRGEQNWSRENALRLMPSERRRELKETGQ